LKKSILFFITLIVCNQLSAKTLGEDPDLGDFEKIRADVVCGDKGGAFHINTKEGLVWQAELNDTEGLPLTVTKFQRFRCPSCFDIDAQFDLMGQTAYYELKTRLNFKKAPSPSNGEKPITKMEVRLLKDGYGRKELVEKWMWTCR
jgi:hypothetical protein